MARLRTAPNRKIIIIGAVLFFCLLSNFCYSETITIVDPIPAAPSNLTASFAYDIAVKLTWTDNSDNEQGFIVERKAGNGQYIQFPLVSAGITRLIDAGTEANTTYTYRVCAYNAVGSSSYSTISITTPPPPAAPSNLIATYNVSKNQVELTWAWTGDPNKIEGFRIERMIGQGSYVRFYSPANTRQYNDTAVVLGTTYTYKMYAYKGGALSEYSNEVKITLDALPPAGSITINNNAQYTNTTAVTLTLSAQDNPGGSGLSQMKFSNDSINWSSPENYAATKTWDLTGGDGEKTVYVKFSDKAGNWSSAVSDTITLDTIAPKIIITNPQDNAVVNTPNITVNYTSDGTAKTKQVALTEGLNTVTIQETDPAGNTGSASIKVTLDTIAPTGSIQINNGTQYTNQIQVILNLSASDTLSGIDKMQFSNNGADWSMAETYSTTKTWDLTVGDGEKTVYVKFYDKAGNISQTYSDSIILYIGTPIGPDGGEVTSPDGRAKVIIPPGAVDAPTQIRIIPLDITQIENMAPNNYSLLIAIQCEPAELVFKEAVKLIFTLDKPEIPGTLVRLGRKGEQDTEFIPLGRESPVAEDGYTLEFTLVSFSSYAGLSSMLSQGAPIGAGVKIPLPDLLTGAFGHSIPITVPPGRKGMQPNVSLQYRSSSPNSWCGVGWSINPGYIIRSTKLGPPTYDDTKDTFIFVTDSGSTELTHLIDNLYQAKIESAFAKFYKEADDSWKVVQKDGTILLFGEEDDSKETADSGTFLWNLTKVTDNNGNYIAITYTKDQGKSYLQYIDYTGPSPKNRVEFISEDREDKYTSFISGSEIKTAKRLKQIVVTQNPDSNPVWTYDLEYYKPTDYPESKPNTNRSLLKSITQKASDGKVFPTQTFTYQRAND